MPETSTEHAYYHRPTQRGGYSAELESFLTTSSSLLGERSNFSGLVASIERGGSGGCSGTKGVGMTRFEPFENWKGEFFKSVHQAFSRLELCEAAWRRMGLRNQWILAARYCYSREKLPHGMHGQLGDLSAVVLVLAMLSDDPDGQMAKIFTNADKWVTGRGGVKTGKLKPFETSAGIALELAHAIWRTERAHVDTMVALGGQT